MVIFSLFLSFDHDVVTNFALIPDQGLGFHDVRQQPETTKCRQIGEEVQVQRHKSAHYFGLLKAVFDSTFRITTSLFYVICLSYC